MNQPNTTASPGRGLACDHALCLATLIRNMAICSSASVFSFWRSEHHAFRRQHQPVNLKGSLGVILPKAVSRQVQFRTHLDTICRPRFCQRANQLLTTKKAPLG